MSLDPIIIIMLLYIFALCKIWKKLLKLNSVWIWLDGITTFHSFFRFFSWKQTFMYTLEKEIESETSSNILSKAFLTPTVNWVKIEYQFPIFHRFVSIFAPLQFLSIKLSKTYLWKQKEAFCPIFSFKPILISFQTIFRWFYSIFTIHFFQF